MSDALALDAMTESYFDVKDAVYAVCWKFKEKYGGDIDDIVSEAHQHFMKAYEKYDSSRTNFVQWVRFYISHNLLETVRTKAQRNNRCPRTYVEITDLPTRDSSTFVDDFLAELSDDARVVARLLFETKISEAKLKKYAQSHLQRELGWPDSKVLQAFDEISQAIR